MVGGEVFESSSGYLGEYGEAGKSFGTDNGVVSGNDRLERLLIAHPILELYVQWDRVEHAEQALSITVSMLRSNPGILEEIQARETPGKSSLAVIISLSDLAGRSAPPIPVIVSADKVTVPVLSCTNVAITNLFEDCIDWNEAFYPIIYFQSDNQARIRLLRNHWNRAGVTTTLDYREEKIDFIDYITAAHTIFYNEVFQSPI